MSARGGMGAGRSATRPAVGRNSLASVRVTARMAVARSVYGLTQRWRARWRAPAAAPTTRTPIVLPSNNTMVPRRSRRRES